MFAKLWAIIRDETKRKVIGWLGGGLVVLVGAGWTVFTYLDKSDDSGSKPSIQVTATGGSVAVGGDVTASIIIIPPPEQLEALITAAKQPLARLTEQQQATIRALGLNEPAVKKFFRDIGEEDIPPERVPEKLEEFAVRFCRLQKLATPAPGDTPEIAELKAKARQELDGGNLLRADTLLHGIGVAFVIDTSISMRPFIELVRQTIASVYGIAEREQVLGYFSSALVGYRNNMDDEYVYRIFQPLDATAPVEAILANMLTMREEKVSTHSFARDAMAGLHAAIYDLDWSPYTYRFIILVTDASALEGVAAKFRGESEITIAKEAQRKGIAIIPIHLLSAAAMRAGDIDRARKQYEYLARHTGDPDNPKYIPVKEASERIFKEHLRSLENKMSELFRRARCTVISGRLPELEMNIR